MELIRTKLQYFNLQEVANATEISVNTLRNFRRGRLYELSHEDYLTLFNFIKDILKED